MTPEARARLRQRDGDQPFTAGEVYALLDALDAAERERDELKVRNERQAMTLTFQADSQNVTMSSEYVERLEREAQESEILQARVAALERELDTAATVVTHAQLERCDALNRVAALTAALTAALRDAADYIQAIPGLNRSERALLDRMDAALDAAREAP